MVEELAIEALKHDFKDQPAEPLPRYILMFAGGCFGVLIVLLLAPLKMQSAVDDQSIALGHVVFGGGIMGALVGWLVSIADDSRRKLGWM
ncbi:MAG: hypothetical protein SynsKO_26150 [Synoicihabitans sp.]